MSLKAELETWASALKAYDDQDLEKSLELFSSIGDSSKILTNIGLIYATLGEHEAAVENFNSATSLDQYLAVAYFQCGVSNFLLGRYELAMKDFEEALLYLRGNQAINYEQLGLKFRLYSAEVLFNKGLCSVYMGNIDEGIQDMREAQNEKATEEHNVIDDAIQDQGEGYTVFSIPVGVLYRPPDSKIKNLKSKDYMGTARLVASANPNDAYTAFTGSTLRARGFTPTGAPLDRPPSDPSSDRPAKARASSPQPARAQIERSNTTINVISAADREARSGPGSIKSDPGSRPGGGGAGAGGGPPAVRSLSVRRNPGPGGPGGPGAPDKPPPKPTAQGSRVTEIYEDYLDAYSQEDPPALPEESKRVAAWAKNSQGAPPLGRSVSSRPPPSSYGGSTGSLSGRRSVRRRPTYRTPSRAMSQYDEEEEGYMSGEYDDSPFELIKIRVKLHYNEDVRGMALSPETPFEEFIEKVCAKFGKPYGKLGFKFKDEDGGKVSLKDDTDYELAIETARESAKGKPEGKLEVWCTDE